MNVVLIGYRGSGKSTVGRALARRLGWPYLDTDGLAEARCGMSIRELYADRAEEGFRDIEAAVIAEVAGLDEHVIATGGGAVLRDRNVAALRRNGVVVYLEAAPEVLWERIFADDTRRHSRPEVNAARGLSLVREELQARAPVYRRAADCVIDTTGRSVQDIVELIVGRLASPDPVAGRADR